jgi:hypothetical protein
MFIFSMGLDRTCSGSEHIISTSQLMRNVDSDSDSDYHKTSGGGESTVIES